MICVIIAFLIRWAMNNQSTNITRTQDKILECQKLIDKFREEIGQDPSRAELRTSLSLYNEYQATLKNLLRAEQQQAIKAKANEPSPTELTILPISVSVAY
jgi:hypothetical protein